MNFDKENVGGKYFSYGHTGLQVHVVAHRFSNAWANKIDFGEDGHAARPDVG